MWAQMAKGASEFFVTTDLQFNRILQNRALEQAGRFHRRGFGIPLSPPIGIGAAGKADCESSAGQRGHHHQINRISTMASAISHAQLNAQLAQGTLAPLYAVVGEEDLLRDMGLGALEDCVVGGGRERLQLRSVLWRRCERG